MSEYSTGTVNVVNGSATITLVGGAAIGNIFQNNLFSVVDPILPGAGVLYTVAADAVTDDEFQLSAPWSGDTASGRTYGVHRDFTPGGIPLWAPGDVNIPALYNRGIALLEAGGLGGGGGGDLPSFSGNANRVLATNTGENAAEWRDHRMLLNSLTELVPTALGGRLVHYSSLSGSQNLNGKRVQQWNDISGANRHATADLIGPIAVGRVGRASYGLDFNAVPEEELRMIATVPANASTMFFFAIARCGPTQDVNRNLFKTAHASGPPDTQIAGDIELSAISSGNGLQFRVSTSAAVNQLLPLGALKNGKPFAVALGFNSGTVTGWVWGQDQSVARISTTYQHGAGFNSDRVRLGSSVDANYAFTLHELAIASAMPSETNMQRLLLWAITRYSITDIGDESDPRVYSPLRIVDQPVIGAMRATILCDGEDITGFFGPPLAMTVPGEVTLQSTWSRGLLRHTGNGTLTVNLPNTLGYGYEIDLEQRPGTNGAITLILASGAANENGFSLSVRPGRRLSLRVAENSDGVSARYASYIATVYNNFGGSDAPTNDTDESLGYELGSLHFDAEGGGLYFCRDPSIGTAVWVPLSTAALGALSSLNAVPGSRVYTPDTTLNAASGNVTFDPESDHFYIVVSGHSVSRNLDLTPAAGSLFPSRSLFVHNAGSANLVVRDHAAVIVATIAAGNLQLFNWDASAWSDGLVWPGGTGGGGFGAYAETVAAVDVGDGGTLTAASHGEFFVDGTTFRRRKVRFRHATTPANPVTVTVEDSLAQRIEWHVAGDQTGLVTLQRATSATINGVTSVQLGPEGSAGVIIPIGTNIYRLKGDTRETITLNSSVVGAGQVISDVELKDVAETFVALGNVSGALSLNYSTASWQQCVATGNITSVAVTNPPASGKAGTLTLEIHQDGTGNRTIAWGAAFSFPGGTDHTLSTAANAVDIFVLSTRSGGTTWRVALAGKAWAP